MAGPRGRLQAISERALLAIDSVARKLLDPFSGIALAGIDVALAVQAHLVDPVKFPCHPAAAPEPAQLLQIASVQQVDGHICVIAYVEATLRRVFGEAHGNRGANDVGVLADKLLGDESTFAGGAG